MKKAEKLLMKEMKRKIDNLKSHMNFHIIDLMRIIIH